MATLDRLKDALVDQDKIAVVAGERGSKNPSYIEKKGSKYCGMVAGQSVEGHDFDELVRRLRERSGSKTYDLAWSASWTAIDHKEAMTWVKRTLSEYLEICGVSAYNFCQLLGISKELLRQIESGGPVPEAKAKKIADVLSKEFERPIQVTDIRGLKVC